MTWHLPPQHASLDADLNPVPRAAVSDAEFQYLTDMNARVILSAFGVVASAGSVRTGIYDVEKGPTDYAAPEQVTVTEIADDDPTNPGVGPAPLVVGVPRAFQAAQRPCYCCARRVDCQIRLNDGTQIPCCLECAERELGYVPAGPDGLLAKKASD
jgi:hypothetical protein